MPPKKNSHVSSSNTIPVDAAMMQQMMDLLQQQTALIQQQQEQWQQQRQPLQQGQQQPPQPQAQVIVTFKTFQSVKPPEFKGTTDPVEAKAWLKEIEKAFELVQVGEEQKTS